MEGKSCLVCGAVQGVSLTVFPFPRSGRLRGAWLTALRDATIQRECLEDNNQYGVCEKHFHHQDIKRGRKTNLSRKAVPLVLRRNITGKQGNGGTTFTSDITDSSWQDPEDCSKGTDNPVIVTVTMEDYHPGQSPDEGCVGNVLTGNCKVSVKECVCLVCGRDGRSCSLMELLSIGPQPGKVPLSLQLGRVVGRAKREMMCVSMMICSRCEALVQEVTQLEDDLKIKKQTVKNMFEATLHCQREKMKVSQTSSASVCEPCDSNGGVHSDETLVFDMASPNKMEDDNGSFSNDEKEVEGPRKTARRRATAKKYCCPQCHEVYTSLALWVHHLSKHSDTEDVASPGKTKQTASKIKKRHKEGGIHTCEECGSTFLCKQSLMAHVATHQKSWDCSVCGRYLTTKARLKAHLFRFHAIGEERNKEVTCPDCGKCFGTKAGLRYHRNVVHRVGTEYSCQHCDKVFHYHVPYRSHLLYAHGEKKVVCETCGEKFFTISKLNTHINAIHRNAQSWTCDQCQDKFTTHTAYRHHVNVKHLKVHHTCSYCNTRFRKKSSLLLHLWKHSVFICHICLQDFPSDEDLRSHAASAHGRELGWRGRRKHGPGLAQDKKLVGVQEAAIEKVPSTTSDEQLQQNEHVASIVINDLLMTAETYDNSSLQPFSLSACEKLPEKVAYSSHDQLKMKGLSIMETSRDLDTTQFGTVEVKSSSPDHMGMAPGVSLINVQILGEMDISQSDTLGDLKGSILDPEDPPHHHLPVDTRLSGDHLSVAPELEGPHPLETPEDHLEVASLDGAGDHHLASATTIQVPDSLEEAPQELHLDPHHPCPLPSIVTSMEADGSGRLVEQDETCLDEERKEAEGSLHKHMEGVDIEPLVALSEKGEVQYVMYISAQGEDSNPG